MEKQIFLISLVVGLILFGGYQTFQLFELDEKRATLQQEYDWTMELAKLAMEQRESEQKPVYEKPKTEL